MKILLDECVDQRFRKELAGHSVSTVQEAGWAGKKNGELLKLAAGNFEVFITVDRNLYFQQNITELKIAVPVLRAPTNRVIDLKVLAPTLLARLSELKLGQNLVISRPSRKLSFPALPNQVQHRIVRLFGLEVGTAFGR